MGKKAYSKEYLSEKIVSELLEKAKAGDNEAWEELFHNFDDLIYKVRKDYLLSKNLGKPLFEEDLEDLYQAGRTGMISAIRNYEKSRNNKFTTYAYECIKCEIRQEYQRIHGFGRSASLDAMQEEGSEAVLKLLQVSEEDFVKDFLDESTLPEQERELKDLGTYSSARSVLQMEYLLKRMTDENHTLSFVELQNLLRFYRAIKYHNSAKGEDVPIYACKMGAAVRGLCGTDG